MSSLDRARIDRLLNAEDPPDAAERGVTYEFLERLLHKQKLMNLTTRQVSEKETTAKVIYNQAEDETNRLIPYCT